MSRVPTRSNDPDRSSPFERCSMLGGNGFKALRHAQGIRFRQEWPAMSAGPEGRSRMAARLGIEPRLNESESFVLPLHHRAVSKLKFSAAS